MKKANTYIVTQSIGATDTIVLVSMGHLIVRSTFLIIAATGTLVFYGISVLRPEVSLGLPVLGMGIFSGIMMNLVNNVWDELSEAALASLGPERYLDDLEAKLGESFAHEFKNDIAGLRMIVSQVWQQRQAMMTIAAYVDAMGQREAVNPTGAADARTAASETAAPV